MHKERKKEKRTSKKTNKNRANKQRLLQFAKLEI
jgi:hypothetical protein